MLIPRATQSGRGGTSLPTGLRSGCLRAAQGPKFNIPLPRIFFVPRPIEYACQVPSTSAQRSRSPGRFEIYSLLRYTVSSRKVVQGGALRSLKIIQDHRNWYQLKAHKMPLPVSLSLYLLYAYFLSFSTYNDL